MYIIVCHCIVGRGYKSIYTRIAPNHECFNVLIYFLTISIHVNMCIGIVYRNKPLKLLLTDPGARAYNYIHVCAGHKPNMPQTII